MTSYDENIKENPFWREIEANYNTLLDETCRKKWILCVPRNGSLKRELHEKHVRDHILLPIPTKGGNEFQSLNNINYKIVKDRIMLVTKEDEEVSRVLFKETFYMSKLKLSIFCIDQPLQDKIIGSEALDTISNLQDCFDILQKQYKNTDMLIKLNDICDSYLIDKAKLVFTYNSHELISFTHELYNKCLKIALEYLNLVKENSLELNNIKLAVEMYVQYSLKNKIFNAICMSCCQKDAGFNKKVRNLHDVCLKYFTIGNDYDNINNVKQEISKMNKYTTTLDKIACIKKGFQLITKENLTSDELIETFAFVIIKLSINNWIANLIYMKEFQFTITDMKNETSFLLTTLEAAIEYISSGALLIKCNFESELNLDPLFRCICEGNTAKIDVMLNAGKQLVKAEETRELCHPLCSCVQCAKKVNEDNAVSLQLIDDRGRNCLHLACIVGTAHVVEYFLAKKCDLAGIDYSGSTPLHYTASKGHQNALLLLLHAGADINSRNADGNTPLHLATNSGHENCVKALLYYSEHKYVPIDTNAKNTQGDTCLHLAARWGYSNIVLILLQYDANPSIANHAGLYSSQLTYNYYIKRVLFRHVLKRMKTAHPTPVKNVTNDSSSCYRNIKDNLSNSDSNISYGVYPRTDEQIKNVENLLKAVQNNDYPLTSFYLGKDAPSIDSSTSSTCHPLCTCSSCYQRIQDDKHLSSTSLNTVRSKCCVHVNCCNKDGYTALHFAAKFGRVEITRLLLDCGAGVNLRTRVARYTPLHLSCLFQQQTIVKELLQCGSCNIDLKDAEGNTPLHYACMKTDRRIVEILLKQGADLSMKNLKGNSALQEAQKLESVNIINLFGKKCTSKVLNDFVL